VVRRRTILSSAAFLLFAASFSPGTEHQTAEHESTPSLEQLVKRRITLDYPNIGRNDWIESVTMTELPPGSIVTRFDGLHGFIMKQLRGQCRRFVRLSTDRQWYVPREADSQPAYWTTRERDWVGASINGAWWTRSWLQSRAHDEGGAPKSPIIHTYGSELCWRFGPLSLSNTFKVRLDYIGLLELAPDPVEPQGQLRRSPVSIDVTPDGRVSLGHSIVFNAQPRVRLSVPKGSDLLSVIQGASLDVTFDLARRGRSVIRGGVQLSWKSSSGLELSVDFEVFNW